MRLSAAIGAFILALGFGSASVSATVLYQSIPDLSAPRFDTFCSNCPGIADQQSVGQIFSFGASATAKSLSFVVSNDYVWPTSVTVGIYQDAVGTVGASVYKQTFASFVSDVPTTNSTDIVSVNLGGGVTLGSGNYLVFLTNSTTGLAIATFGGQNGNAIYDYASTFPDLAGNPYASLVDQPDPNALPTVQDIGVLFSSDSVSAVPEPSTWLMLLFGFVGIGFITYWRNSKLAYPTIATAEAVN
jgi:hypothetical protein